MIFSQTHLLFIYISSSNVLLFWLLDLLLLCYNLLLPSLAKLWINTIRYVWFWQILLKLWIRSVKLNKSQGQDEWADRNNDLLWAFRYLLCSFAILVHQDVMDNDPINSNLSDCHHPRWLPLSSSAGLGAQWTEWIGLSLNTENLLKAVQCQCLSLLNMTHWPILCLHNRTYCWVLCCGIYYTGYVFLSCKQHIAAHARIRDVIWVFVSRRGAWLSLAVIMTAGPSLISPRPRSPPHPRLWPAPSPGRHQPYQVSASAETRKM